MEDVFIADLSTLAENEFDEALGCGQLGFKLANATQEAIITTTQDGFVTIASQISDQIWVGQHDIKFTAYLKDLDSEGDIMSWTLDFCLTLLVEVTNQV